MEEEPIDAVTTPESLEEKLQEFIKARCEYVIEAEMRKYADGYFKNIVLPRMIKEVQSQIHSSLVSSRGHFKFEIYYGPKNMI